MKYRLLILLVVVSFLLCGCDKRQIDLQPGLLYHVTTTEGEGFVRFDHLSDDQWSGVYYLSVGRLMAEKRNVKLKIGQDLAFVDEMGKEIPILCYSLYEEPTFKDNPEAWTYNDTIYSVLVENDVPYGKAQGYWVSYPDTGGTYLEIFNAKKQELHDGKKELELTMDIYLPDDGRKISRPLLVLIHGGAFFNGDKTDLGFPEWAHDFASMGYVVASVNYRLGFKKNLTSVKRAGVRAVQDVDAAIRYIVHDKDTYDVDPDRVFVAGTSAGGITALNVAFMRDENIPFEAKEEGCIKYVNPEIRDSYKIRAVGNMWGAIYDLSLLENSSTSVISFHNIGDPVVPYEQGYPFDRFFLNWLIFPTMYGSRVITDALGDRGSMPKCYNLSNRHTLHTDIDEKGCQVLCSRFYEIEEYMRDYFSTVMQPSPIVANHESLSQVFQVDSPELDSIYWHVEGGGVMEQNNNRIDILLFPDASSHSVVVSGKYKSGLTFRHEWNL